MPYGAILLPNESAAEALVRFSQKIGESVRPLLTLGRSAPPHVTLLHVDGEFEAAKRWWASVVEEIPPTIEIKTRTLGFALIEAGNYYVPEGGVYVGCEAVRHPALDRAHGQALGAAHDCGLEIVSAAGDEYNPHITMAILDRMPVANLDALLDVVPRDFSGSVAFGELGPYGTFPRIIERKG